MQLRDYQVDLINQINENWQSHRKVMAQLPTGGGKSVIFGSVAKASIDQGHRILVVAHREELLTQAAAHLSRWCGDNEIGMVKGGKPLTPTAPIQVASIQSLNRRLSKLGEFGLVILDECHHSTAASYVQAIEAFPNAKILGLTATPCRTDNKGFSGIFEALACGITTKALIEQGHLSKFKYFAAPDKMATGKTFAGDYAINEIADLNDVALLCGNLIQSYRRHADGLSCVVFAINVEHSKEVAAAYTRAGIPAAHLDGTSESEHRASTLQAFRDGEIKVLSNVGLFDEGVDIPALQAVQLARPTKSLSKYLQMVGRALRTAPGKEHAIIIDHTTNWEIHQLPDYEREWSLDPIEVIKTTEGTRLVENKTTGGVETEIILVESAPDEILSLVTESPAIALAKIADRVMPGEYEILFSTAEERGYKPGWIVYRLIELNPPYWVWETTAARLGYKSRWAWHQQQKARAAAAEQLESSVM